MTKEEEALRWIIQLVDKELASDAGLRARGARTLKRIAAKAEEALGSQ